MAKRQMKEDEVFDVRVGDHWANYGNNGTTERRVTKVESVEKWGRHARIYYTDACGYKTHCLSSTFQRWWKTAFLDFTLDWSGREVDGRTLKTSLLDGRDAGTGVGNGN